MFAHECRSDGIDVGEWGFDRFARMAAQQQTTHRSDPRWRIPPALKSHKEGLAAHYIFDTRAEHEL